MALKAILTPDEHAELDEHYRELYSERDGQFEITGIQGVKTEADVTRVQTALTKERGDHKSTKARLGVWGELDHEKTMGQLDRIPELEAAAADKIDEDKLEEMAESRALTRLKPMEREILRLKESVTEGQSLIEGYRSKEVNRTINGALRKAGADSKMLNPDDAVVFGRSKFGINDEGEVRTEDGLTPDQWLVDMQPNHTRLWGATSGGGAVGAGGMSGIAGENPFSHENWNLTKQGQVYRDKGEAHADALAKAAGTSVGGLKPKAKVK